MNITLNNRPTEAFAGETILEVARRTGHTIPALCYAKGAKHTASCMVCAVKNRANEQIIPACSTYPTEGMDIDTDSEEIRYVRRLSLELLVSDHRADCEAPCSMVCPKGLDVEQVLDYFDRELHEKAYERIAAVFSLPAVACDTCKAPCEKACRRGQVDHAVSIRTIIREIVGSFEVPIPAPTAAPTADERANPVRKPDKDLFRSMPGRFTDREKARLRQTVSTPSRCLHCACAGRTDCKLRLYATVEGIKRSRYGLSSSLPVMQKTRIAGDIWFEQSKCIRCGLCVYNSDAGFTFKGRGFDMQVVLPEENRAHIREELAALCPTGAIYIDARFGKQQE